MMPDFIKFCGYLLVLAIGASVKPMYDFLLKMLKPEQNNNFITHKEFDEKTQQFYCDFVKKETYKEHKEATDAEFKEFKNELKEIKTSQISQNLKMAEIDKNIALMQKDFSYLCKALNNLPKRKED